MKLLSQTQLQTKTKHLQFVLKKVNSQDPENKKYNLLAGQKPPSLLKRSGCHEIHLEHRD